MKKKYAALLLVAVVLFAGCVDPANQTVIAQSSPLSDTDVVNQTTVQQNETIPAVQNAIENGRSGVTDEDDAIADHEAVAADGSYYVIDQSLVAGEDATAILYRVKTVSNTSADYEFEQLTDEDKGALFRASFLADESEDRTLESQRYVNDTELPESVLAGQQSVVVNFNGTLYEVSEVSRE